MELRNIHFQSAAVAELEICQEPEPQPQTMDDVLKIRRVKTSPAEEYRLRAGNPRPISMSLAAMILSRSGKAEVTSKGIRIDRTDIGKRSYWHSDSRLCNDLSHRNRKVFYVVSALQPEIIHLLDESGRYLESLPQVEGVAPFDEEATIKAHAAKERAIGRITKHMQRIHQPDSDAALEAKSLITSEMQRVVTVLNTPVNSNQDEAPSPLGDRITLSTREGQQQTYRDINALVTVASRKSSLPAANNTRQTAMDLLLTNSNSDDEFDL